MENGSSLGVDRRTLAADTSTEKLDTSLLHRIRKRTHGYLHKYIDRGPSAHVARVMRATVIALALLLGAPTANAFNHKSLGEVLICANAAPLRDAPGVFGFEIKTIKRGAVLPVMRVFERNWLNVVYEGESRWVHRSMAKWSYQYGLHEYGRGASCSEPLPQES